MHTSVRDGDLVPSGRQEPDGLGSDEATSSQENDLLAGHGAALQDISTAPRYSVSSPHAVPCQRAPKSSGVSMNVRRFMA